MQRDGSRAFYAGGLLLFLGFLAGSAIGISLNEPSLGAMAGVGIAALLAFLLWFRRRDRA